MEPLVSTGLSPLVFVTEGAGRSMRMAAEANKSRRMNKRLWP
jgi:hypothetical protein